MRGCKMKKLILSCCFCAIAAASQAADLLTFKIVAKDGKLTPAQVTAPAGQRIKFEIANQGKTPIEFENLQLRVEKVLGPGAQSFVVLNPLKPGRYQFIDEFHPETGKLELVIQ